MVATLLSELAGKGLGRFGYSNDTKEIDAFATATTATPQPTSSLKQAAQSAYSNISNAYSSLQVPSLNLVPGRPTLVSQPEEQDDLCDSSASISGLSKSSVNSKRRRKSMLSPNLLTLMNNPYIGVRGGGRLHRAKPPHQSMDAVRKLLYVVEDDKKKHNAVTVPSSDAQQQHVEKQPLPFPPLTPNASKISSTESRIATPRHRNSASNMEYNNNHDFNDNEEMLMHPLLSQQLATIDSMSRQSSSSLQVGDKTTAVVEDHSKAHSITVQSSSQHKQNSSHSPEETASQLTEGTLRAMRDLALDEALALHNSLKYWSDRWERPVFSWFVAGPQVWFGFLENTIYSSTHNENIHPTSFGGGYDHSEMVGKRVSQIQAVLARRLMAIGELQHHLLRAGWQRGVAHWGFLGEGGNWAAVDGTDGRMGDDDDSSHQSCDDSDHEEEDDFQHEEDFNYEDSSELFIEDNSNNTATNALNATTTTTIKPLDLHNKLLSHNATTNNAHNRNNPRYKLMRREVSDASVGSIGLHIDVPPPPSPFSTKTLTGPGRISQHEERRKHGSLYYANLHVRKHKGGLIQKDDMAMAEWSIDALALIRRQLIRAANGKHSLPYSENWPFEHAAGNSSVHSSSNQNAMPVWAGMKYIGGNNNINHSKPRNRMETRGSCYSITEDDADNPFNSGPAVDTTNNDTQFPKIGAECFENQSEDDSKQFSSPKKRSPSSRSIASTKNERAIVGISNLPLMMSEVSGLLDVMEDIMDIQRARRMEKLKPPPWWRQNWFLLVLAPPTLGYLLYNNLIGKGQTWSFVKYAAEKMMDFAREHVVLPCVALYDEFTKGPESISDHAARDTATETLKKMIRSWLDETYPEMQEAEKVRLSDAMDITLVEESKESSMKSVYNMNSVIRMSFIEAQFIKKEMMNALVALDEMQASTNFNMNLAAITPFVLLCWAIKRVSRFIYYTAFKWGKSRKETYRSFLDALTEIERLLIMRSNPPAPPIQRSDLGQAKEGHASDCVLESDDLGMLMLHVHELRTILWQERRRFSPNALRSVSEDLAELSGERGAVSVRQQLLIVERMNRAYSFLKQGAID